MAHWRPSPGITSNGECQVVVVPSRHIFRFDHDFAAWLFHWRPVWWRPDVVLYRWHALDPNNEMSRGFPPAIYGVPNIRKTPLINAIGVMLVKIRAREFHGLLIRRNSHTPSLRLSRWFAPYLWACFSKDESGTLPRHKVELICLAGLAHLSRPRPSAWHRRSHLQAKKYRHYGRAWTACRRYVTRNP